MTDTERKLGRYELLRRIASGGMGEIYLARTRGAGGFEKMVIIKTILSHLAEEEEFVTKFLDEGRIVVQLTHGNIVPVFDMGEEDGEYFIAMEYVPGLDLRAVLKRKKARDEHLPVEHALYVASEICKGLGYAHRKTDDQGNPLGIVHRDVSPSNVLISREGEVKIIDFGIARAAGKVAKTLTGRIQGKCCYMSPEQARGKALDARSDIFSTGVLLYEMLTLTRPFHGRSDLESLDLVRECEFDPPGVLRPEIPEEVDQIIARAMARSPDDRYPAIDDMFVDLQDQIYQLGTPVTSQQLVAGLGDIFSDESSEAQTKKTAERPANLDEALELELARLGGDTPAPSSAPGSPLGLAATATSAPGGTHTLSAPPDSIDGDDQIDSSPDPTSPENTAPSRDSRPTPRMRPQDIADGTDDDGGDALDNDASLDSGEVDTSASIAPAVRRRHLVATLIAVITITAGIATTYLLTRSTDGTLELATDPPGAQIYLDGDELAGQRTPQTLALAPDSYNIELVLDGYRPYDFRVDIDSGQLVSLDENDLQLHPKDEPQRIFTITTEPEDATLIADGEARGSSPQEISLKPDEVINLSARASGCSAIYYALTYGHEREDVHLALECEEERPGSDDDDDDDRPDDDDERPLLAERQREAVPSGTASADNQRTPVLIDTDPAGAQIHVDDESIGESPLYAELHRSRTATIEAQYSGYQTYRADISPSELDDDRLRIVLEERPRGCLDFRAVYPANNEIAINDEWLDGRHMTLQNHSLPAGNNTITVRHPESDREETFQVDIEAGSDCTVLTVWEPD